MKSSINETYIANMSAYLHSLSDDEMLKKI